LEELCQRQESGKPAYNNVEAGAQGEVTVTAGTTTLSSQQGTARISQPFAGLQPTHVPTLNALSSLHPVGLTFDRHSRTDGCKKISWEASKRFSNHQSLHHHH